MSDKLLLNYKGNLDVTDIPGALAGSKMNQLQRIQGRDYINVHDIAGALPKINVGYTGKKRWEGDNSQERASIQDRLNGGQQQLIGMPRLRNNDQKQYHSRDRSQLVQNYNGFALQQPQQNFNMNNYHSHNNSSSMIQRGLPSQSLNSDQMDSHIKKNVRYEDALDKFINQQQTSLSNNQSALNTASTLPRNTSSFIGTQSIKNQDSVIQSNPDSYQTKRDNEVINGTLLSARNSDVAKSTANLIIKNQNNYETERQNRYTATLNDTMKDVLNGTQITKRNTNSLSNSPKGSPAQVQKKFKEIQSQLNIQMTLEPKDSYLSKIAQRDSIMKQRKNQDLFNINYSTVPSDGRYQERPLEGSIRRSLNLAPSTLLGQHHREEIDESIQKREYTKLGGGGMPIQMPNQINNISYHRHNQMKDYTYNNLTGAYYNKVPQ